MHHQHQHSHRVTSTSAGTKKETSSNGNKEEKGDIEMDMQSHGTRERRVSSELSAECFSPIMLQLHNHDVNNHNNNNNNNHSNGHIHSNGNNSSSSHNGNTDREKNDLIVEGDDQLKSTSADTDPGSVDRLMPVVLQQGNSNQGLERGSDKDKNSKKSSEKGEGMVGEERMQIQLQSPLPYSMHDNNGNTNNNQNTGNTMIGSLTKDIVQEDEDDDDDEEDEDILGFWYSIVWLAVITVFISFLSDALVDSITAASAGMKVTDAIMCISM